MKSSLQFLFLVLAGTIMTVTAEAQAYLTKEFSVSAPRELRVKINGGSISVSSREGDKVRVELYVRKGARLLSSKDSDVKKLMEDFDIKVTQSGNTVLAEVERKRDVGGWFSWFTGDNISISCTVFVPKDISCVLNTSGGSIDLQGVTGEQEVRTSGGSLNLKNIRGNMEARTSGGSINLDGYSGRLSAHISGGTVSVGEARGEFDLSTSGGSIRLKQVDGSIEASTSGGGIQASVGSLSKYLRLRTSGGSITASIPSGLGMDLNLSGNSVHTKLENFSGKAEDDKVVGSVNGGGIAVIMSTSGGSVNLEYR